MVDLAAADHLVSQKDLDEPDLTSLPLIISSPQVLTRNLGGLQKKIKVHWAAGTSIPQTLQEEYDRILGEVRARKEAAKKTASRGGATMKLVKPSKKKSGSSTSYGRRERRTGRMSEEEAGRLWL